MSDELFPASEVAADSPRLIWMRKHGIHLMEEPCADGMAYRAFVETYAPPMKTEEEALLALAEMLDIADWREENL